MAQLPLRRFIRSRRWPCVLRTVALVVSAAPWQVMQRALAGCPVDSVTLIVRVPVGSVGSGETPSKLWKMFSPRLAESLIAVPRPCASMNWSAWLLLATSVSMYALTDRPQNREKFASIWLKDLPPMFTGWRDDHHCELNARRIMSSYRVWSPGPLLLAIEPRTLSSRATNCNPSGLNASIL